MSVFCACAEMEDVAKAHVVGLMAEWLSCEKTTHVTHAWRNTCYLYLVTVLQLLYL
jgi:hypothetical protein